MVFNATLPLSLKKVREIYHTPLLELVFRASQVHRQNHNSYEVKASRLISVKTGNCVENCAYCAQSSLYNTGLDSPKMLKKEEVRQLALKAKNSGLSRVCLSASYKELPSGKAFESVLEMIKTVKDLGMDVCLTMGKVNEKQADALYKSGIKAYNHNIDTSESFYPKVITSRTFKERIETLNKLSNSGVNICSGGIIGMGESAEDRVSMLYALATLKKQPFTVPLNILVPVEGTPFADLKPIDAMEMVRMVATTRIIMPKTNISLAAGRREMGEAEQALCFLAGVNAIFIGEKLLTTSNTSPDEDLKMLEKLGVKLI